MPSEQLDQQRAGHVQALGHHGVHRCVVLHALARQRLQAPAHSLRRCDEHRQQRQREQRQAPLERQHGHERRGEHDRVRHHRAERAGERPLGADDVVVHPADQRASLHMGEERDRHPLHMVIQADSQIEDQPFPDARRPPALDERQAGLAERRRHDDRCQHVELPPVSRRNGLVDDAPEQDRRHQERQRSEQLRCEESRQHHPVRPCQGRCPTDGAWRYVTSFHTGWVVPHRAVCGCHRLHESNDTSRSGSDT